MRVRGEGRPTARLVLIGEAPGREEDASGRPFVGAAGAVLERWWRAVGLQRSDFYIDNVVQQRPAGNDIKSVPPGERAAWVESLHDRLGKLDDPWLIVPTGNTALHALIGDKKPISKYRGSILSYVDRRGRTIKVIPTLHPAATFRTAYWEKRCKRDWARIAGDAAFRESRLPERHHHIRPTLGDVEDFVALVERSPGPLAVDIETPGGIVGCVGFALASDQSFTIPTTVAYWGTKEKTSYVWTLVTRLCHGAHPKVLQNGPFDAYYLRMLHGIRLVNYQHDLMWMHHTLDPLEDHDLAFMASVETRQPYWKDTTKDPDKLAQYASDIEGLWEYNGVDCCVQRELYDVFAAQLAGRGLAYVYQRSKAALLEPTIDLMLHGINVDHERRRRRLGKLLVERIGLEDTLAVVAGTKLHAKTGISNQKLKVFVQGLGIKIPRSRGAMGEWTETLDEAAIRKLVRRYPKFRAVGELVLKHRRVARLTTFLAERNFDADGRMRSSYSPTADNGRFRSGKNPRGTGTNAQNQDRAIRDIYVPDAGCVFVELDTSQGEWRILCCLSGDEELIALARKRPDEFDIHAFMAAIIFDKQAGEVTKGERYLAKRVVHGSSYGLKEDTMADAFLTDKPAVALGLQPSAAECARWQRRYFDRFPAIERWQTEVRATILRERRLTNSWGLTYDVESQRLNDELYRACYAFACASELAGLVNEQGFVPLATWLRNFGAKSRINLHNHDALLVSCPPKEAYDVASFLDEQLGRPHCYGGVELRMPCEVSIGLQWGGEEGRGKVAWKRLPARPVVESALEAVAALGGLDYSARESAGATVSKSARPGVRA